MRSNGATAQVLDRWCSCYDRKGQKICVKCTKREPSNAQKENQCPNHTLFLHQETLMANSLPDDLKSVLAETVKLVCFIKTKQLISRLFTLLYEETEADHHSYASPHRSAVALTRQSQECLR